MTVDYTRPPQPSTPQQRGWWSRNWKWVVPAGCLSVVLAIGVFVALIGAAVFGAIHSTLPYKQALHRAQNDPRVIAALGTPVKGGFFGGGTINVDGGSGDADLHFPISGPKGKATVYVEGKKSAGDWNYSVMRVKVEGGPTIDLLSP